MSSAENGLIEQILAPLRTDTVADGSVSCTFEQYEEIVKNLTAIIEADGDELEPISELLMDREDEKLGHALAEARLKVAAEKASDKAEMDSMRKAAGLTLNELSVEYDHCLKEKAALEAMHKVELRKAMDHDKTIERQADCICGLLRANRDSKVSKDTVAELRGLVPIQSPGGVCPAPRYYLAEDVDAIIDRMENK